jgi:two-component system, NarL family, sensor histidine kinase UhpB
MQKPVRILYIEDVSSDAELVLRKLSKAGFSYTHQIVGTRKDYIDAFKSFVPDLILSDYYLPQFDGLDALRIRNEIAIHTPFIFVTASTSEELAVECMKSGADDYILKSNLEGLIPSIKLSIARKSSAHLQKKNEWLFDLEANSIINNLRGAVFRCKYDKVLTIEYMSEGILDLSGYHASDFIMNRLISFMKLIHTDDKKRTVRIINQALKEKKPFTAEYRIISKDGSVKWIWLRGKGVISGNKVIALEGFVTDITERKKAEDDLRSSLIQMRQLTQHIEKIREEERLSISRDLHDDLGQALTSIKIDLGIIKQKITDVEIIKRVNNVTSLVSDAIKSVQRLTGELRPPIIDDLGLEAAIEWYVKEFSNRAGINVQLNIQSGTNISKEASLIVFRIMQESLTNIIRHAKATHVDIDLVKSDGKIEFHISDNGVGIKDDDLSSAQSFGIIGMRERASSLGGTFEISREKNCCTVIQLIFPVNNKGKHEDFNL